MSPSEFVYSFTNDYFDALLSNKKTDKYDMSDDKYKEIYTHRFPYIATEIKSAKPLLIAGCSMTVGGGIEKEEVWADVLAKKMGLEYNNIALAGSSVGRQVRAIFAYIKQYGAPEYIFALFPGFNRIELPNNENFFKMQHKSDGIKDYITTANVETFTEDKYFKIPYEPEFIFPQDMCQYYSNLQIMYLEEYCKALDIKLYWATWHQKQYEALMFVKENLVTYKGNENLVNIYNEMWVVDPMEKIINYNDPKTLVFTKCHEKEHAERPKNFHFAPDQENGVEYAHWGYHRHIHLAEIFFEVSR